MPAYLIENEFYPYQLLESYQKNNLKPGSYGACAQFIGTMRDYNVSSHVDQMYLEHYPAMTQKYLDNLCLHALKEWPLVDCLVYHRFGLIHPGEPIVLTAAWSEHREPAFNACRYLIEELKARAPFWKKEKLHDGERWVHDTLKNNPS